MTYVISCMILAAVCWGGWPVVSRLAGVNSIFGAFVLSATAVIPVGAAALYRHTPSATLPTMRSVAILTAAGMMMGIGLIAFNYVANDRSVDLSKSIPIINSSMLAVTVAGGIILFSEEITPQKVLGFLLVIGGIVLLRPTG